MIANHVEINTELFFIYSLPSILRMTIDNFFCEGRASIHSSGRKNTMISVGLGTCQFTSEGGGVGGEFCLMDSDALSKYLSVTLIDLSFG